jgi:excisionase family DNA binding protein
MTISISGQQYYRTAEACRIAGISKNTFLRWVHDGVFTDVLHRDRRGWRLFTEEDLQRLKKEVNKTS